MRLVSTRLDTMIKQRNVHITYQQEVLRINKCWVKEGHTKKRNRHQQITDKPWYHARIQNVLSEGVNCDNVFCVF